MTKEEALNQLMYELNEVDKTRNDSTKWLTLDELVEKLRLECNFNYGGSRAKKLNY